MEQLIADRFLRFDSGLVIDCASGAPVELAIDSVGSRAEQETWVERCARRLADPESKLIDFGFIGIDRRFEAHSPHSKASPWGLGATAGVVEWLEHTSAASARILHAPEGCGFDAIARELRAEGFVPLAVSTWANESVAAELAPALAGRSVVLLQSGLSSMALSIGFLRLHSARARSVWAIVAPGHTPARRTRIAQVAEGRAVFEKPALRPQSTLRSGLTPMDARAFAMLSEATRMMSRGRHASAERSLRAAQAAFERRTDLLHAGDAALSLGQLLLHRGRSSDSEDVFERARAHYEARGAALEAVRAAVFLGLAKTDRALLQKAEDLLRAAHSAAAALADPVLQTSAGVALARCMVWQARNNDAARVLEKLTPCSDVPSTARYWCLVGRLHVANGNVADAWKAVTQARTVVGATPDPACESLVRTSEASIQAQLGDVDALEFHVREGLRAAGLARLPLQAVRLRIVLLEGLLRAGREGRARDVAKRLAAFSRAALPPLLAHRLRRALEVQHAPCVRETAASFTSSVRICDGESGVDGLAEVLSHCHDLEDERQALARAAAVIRKHASAAGVGIFMPSALGATSVATSGAACQPMAARCLTLGLPIDVEANGGGFEAATPIRYLSRIVGAITCRWSADGPPHRQATMAFCAAAAAACAPLVYTLSERHAQPDVSERSPGFELIGISPAIDDMRRAIARAASAPFAVLIEGESGSGKELVARAIHSTGCRRDRRFCALNCAAMPEDLVDTELFGHAKGAFTGALVERVGLFEGADQGTVFLDEVGELSPRAQAKLLRVLQEGEIRRIGESFTRPIDARLIAATNRSLRAEVEAGRFRQDLLYRLDVIRVVVPPLRERIEDIPLLGAKFWRQAADRIGSKAVLGPGALSALARYDWPGNVRELQNVLTAMVVAVPPRGVVNASHLPDAIARSTTAPVLETLDSARLRFEQRFVRAALARTAGHRRQTASALGLTRQGLTKLMRRLGIDA